MFTLGIDYGTNSVRCVIVRAADGREISSCVVNYPSGQQGILLDPRDHNLARQSPADHLYGLEASIKGAIKSAGRRNGFSPKKVIGIGVDTTGSSPMPVDRKNRPLALDRKWKKHLAAQCWLWKDHTGWREAARIRGNRVRDLNKIQSEAYRQVEEIRGVADAKATEIYAAAYNQSPEAVSFYEFTRTMQSYEAIIAQNTRLVLSTDSDLFKFLKTMSPQDAQAPLIRPDAVGQ